MQNRNSKSWALFALQAFLVGLFLAVTGRFSPVAQTDTASYIGFSTQSLSDILNDTRTFVYPMLLRASLVLTGSYDAIPIFQFGMAIFGAGAFLSVLQRIAWHPGLALAAGSTLLYSFLGMTFVSVLTPDLVAQSLCVIAVTCWILQVTLGGGIASGIGLTLAVFFAYQTKPACLFLLVFVPVGGMIARWWLSPDSKDAFRVGAKLLSMAWLPFLAWCSLRWLIVGHFGLVSFGGFNIVGIAGHMIDESVLQEVSAESRPLGQAILDQRKLHEDWRYEIDYPTIEHQYDGMVWQVAVPSAEALYSSDTKSMNDAMTRLSKEVILLRPRLYVRWLFSAGKHALSEALLLTSTNGATLGSLLIGLLVHAWYGWPRRQRSAGTLEHSETVSTFAREFQLLIWLALGYALCGFALVVLVEPPNFRYSAPATVFCPCVVAALIAGYWVKKRS